MTTLVFALGLVISGPGGLAEAKPAPALPQSAVARAGWLEGCWHHSGERGNPSIRLDWNRASNNLLVGTWIRVPLGFEPEYSFLRIESVAGLSLVWQAPGEWPIRMPADVAVVASDVIAFVNPGAGAPKRVDFRRGKGETLLVQALYEGTKAFETLMKKCT